MAIVTFRYWAAAKEAAGTAEETIKADTLAGALAAVGQRAAGAPGSAPCLPARPSSSTAPRSASGPRMRSSLTTRR